MKKNKKVGLLLLFSITEFFHDSLNFSGVEAGFVVGVLQAGSVDDGDTLSSGIS